MCTSLQFPCVFGLKHVINLMKMNCVKAYWLGCDLIQFYCEIDVKGMNIENNFMLFMFQNLKIQNLLLWPKTCLNFFHPTISLLLLLFLSAVKLPPSESYCTEK
jgi:hypothetical protein